jgi:hypothetical protein
LEISFSSVSFKYFHLSSQVHRFIVADTIEETIHNEIMKNYSKWKSKDITVKNLESLFLVKGEKLEKDGMFNF